MKQVSIGRLMLAVDLADKPGEITLAGFVFVSAYGEVGVHASVLGVHFWVLLMPRRRERGQDG